MQRQAVPLLKTEQAYIGTGLENAVARDSSSVILAKKPGVVESVTGDEIVVKNNNEEKFTRFKSFLDQIKILVKIKNLLLPLAKKFLKVK